MIISLYSGCGKPKGPFIYVVWAVQCLGYQLGCYIGLIDLCNTPHQSKCYHLTKLKDSAVGVIGTCFELWMQFHRNKFLVGALYLSGDNALKLLSPDHRTYLCKKMALPKFQLVVLVVVTHHFKFPGKYAVNASPRLKPSLSVVAVATAAHRRSSTQSAIQRWL